MKFVFAAAAAAAVASAQGWRGQGPRPGPGPIQGYQGAPARPQVRRGGPPKSLGRRPAGPRVQRPVGQQAGPMRQGPSPRRGSPSPLREAPLRADLRRAGPLRSGPIRSGPGPYRGAAGPLVRLDVQKAPEEVVEVVEEPVEQVVEEVVKVEEPAAITQAVWEDYLSLSTDMFEQTVINDKEHIWVVAFVSPTCHSCHALADEWSKLTSSRAVINRKIKFGYVDISMDSNSSILDKFCGDVEVQYTPTVLLYGEDKWAPEEYSGDYTSPSLNSETCSFCDTQGFGIGELLKEEKSKAALEAEAEKAQKKKDRKDRKKKEEDDEDDVPAGKQIIVVGDASAVKEAIEKKQEEKAAQEEAEKAAEEEAEKEEKDEKDEKDEKKDDEKDDDDKPAKPIVVRAPKPEESMPEFDQKHLGDLQTIAEQVIAGSFDIKEPAEDLHYGVGAGYSTGYRSGPVGIDDAVRGLRREDIPYQAARHPLGQRQGRYGVDQRRYRKAVRPDIVQVGPVERNSPPRFGKQPLRETRRPVIRKSAGAKQFGRPQMPQDLRKQGPKDFKPSLRMKRPSPPGRAAVAGQKPAGPGLRRAGPPRGYGRRW